MIEYIVSAEWLNAHQNEANIKIVEATFFLPTMNRDAAAEFTAGHIPNAVFFDIDAISDPDSSLPHMLPNAESFAQSMQELGLNNEDHIIVYDRSSLVSSARAWWMFRFFGHQKISVLDGGYEYWTASGLATSHHSAKIQKGNFTTRAQDEFQTITMQEIADGLENTDFPQIIDARAADRFAGQAAEPRPGLRAGHIPGALNVPINSLFDAQTKCFKQKEVIQALFEQAGVDYGKPAITSCGSGVTACGLILGLALTGKTDIRLYDGSWTEWGSSQNPIATP